MLDVKNCKKCGKIFNYTGDTPICQNCKAADDADFKRVKEYLYDHSGASIFQVSKELEISVQRIKAYLREGRLEIVGDDGNMILECERCGKSIKSGRFCAECSKNVVSDIKSAVNKMSGSLTKENDTTAKRGSGMKYLHKDDK
ncbi:UNVERIFIED_CONTAM: flagellar operon protein (TIGR03826 family) [Acetivibrio alkalicellulosi]